MHIDPHALTRNLLEHSHALDGSTDHATALLTAAGLDPAPAHVGDALDAIRRIVAINDGAAEVGDYSDDPPHHLVSRIEYLDAVREDAEHTLAAAVTAIVRATELAALTRQIEDDRARQEADDAAARLVNDLTTRAAIERRLTVGG